jgi:hypothetical protein
MRSVICHFYNEEYLLPWWLDHHKSIFDVGILINYASTDRSVEICREIVPHWRIVDSFNQQFDSALIDLEVMLYERELEGWKIALNVTEFLCAKDLAPVEDAVTEMDLSGMMFHGAIMVDCAPADEPDASKGLVAQKSTGVFEADLDKEFLDRMNVRTPKRGRLYHRAAIGSYTPGRHSTHLPNIGTFNERVANIFWYGYSPWNDDAMARRLGIAARVSESDKKLGRGAQHMYSQNQWNEERAKFLPLVTDLSEFAFSD